VKILNIAYILGVSILVATINVNAAEEEIILQKVEGEVLVNQGETYTPAMEGMEIFPENLMMVVEGSVAELLYPNECVYEVIGAFILTVDKESPCKVGALWASTAVPVVTAGAQTAVILGGMVGLAIATGNSTKTTISP